MAYSLSNEPDKEDFQNVLMVRMIIFGAKVIISFVTVARTIKNRTISNIEYVFAYLTLIIPFPGVHLMLEDIGKKNQKALNPVRGTKKKR